MSSIFYKTDTSPLKCTDIAISSYTDSLCSSSVKDRQYNANATVENKKFDYKLPGVFKVLQSLSSNAFTLKDVHITQVLYNDPATVVFWSDKTKTVCKCTKNDKYNPETGLAICIIKKLCGNTQVKTLFDSWIPERLFYYNESVTIKDVRKKLKKVKKVGKNS